MAMDGGDGSKRASEKGWGWLKLICLNRDETWPFLVEVWGRDGGRYFVFNFLGRESTRPVGRVSRAQCDGRVGKRIGAVEEMVRQRRMTGGRGKGRREGEGGRRRQEDGGWRMEDRTGPR